MYGIVLEIKEDRCVVMKKDGSFEEIRNRNYAVGQKIRLSKPSYIKYFSAVACLLLVCTTVFGYHLYFTPTSFVYLDINPSIRIDLNCFERVINVVPLNDDAEALLSLVTVSQKNAQDCMNDIVSACQEQNYLNEQNTDIEVSVRTDDQKLESNVETASAAIEDEELKVAVFQMDEEENDSAIKHHISARRLRAVRAYTETFGGTLEKNMQELQGISSDEIYETIQAYRHTSYPEDTSAVQPEASSSLEEIETESPDTDDTQPPESEEKTSNLSYPVQESPDSNSRPETENSNSNSMGGHRLTAKRLTAIRAYTDQFGGTLEENTAFLRGVSSAEIYRLIDEANSSESETSDLP